MGDNNAECNVDYGSPAQETSQGNNSGNWARDPSCEIQAKGVAEFCLCPKNLPDAKLKSFGLILLAEEISRQPSTDCQVVISVNS